MASENEFPKVDGDVFYASEANKVHFRSKVGVVEVAELEMDNVVSNFCNSLTPVSKSCSQTDIYTDSDGYLDKVDTTNTDADYCDTGACLTSYYYNSGVALYDVFDGSIDSSKWDQCGSGTKSETSTKQTVCIAAPASAEGCIVSNNLSNIIGGEVTLCYSYYLDSTGGSTCYARGCVLYGGCDTSTHSVNFSNDCSSGSEFLQFCRVNADCVDWYRGGVCQGQIETSEDSIALVSNISNSNAGGYSCNSWCQIQAPAAPNDKSVYTVAKDFTDNVDFVYATADYTADTGTCVLYDVLKGSDCSVLSSGNALGSYADLSGCNESNIILRYNLCSTETGCCVCMCKHSYVVSTN